MTTLSSLEQTRKGILFMVLASFFFALTMVFAKLLSSRLSSIEITFFRNLIGLVLITAMIVKQPLKPSQGRHSLLLIFRGIIGTLALLTFFYTLSCTTLSETIIFAKTEPLFTAILSFLFFNETLTRKNVMALLLGFLGIVIVYYQTLHLSYIGLLTGFLSALAYVSVRQLKPYYDERIVVISFMVAGVIIPLCMMFLSSVNSLFQPFILPQGYEWLWIILLGIVAGYGQLFMTRAYFYAHAGVVSTASYSVVIFATLLGILLGDPIPSFSILIGAGCIMFSGILLFL